VTNTLRSQIKRCSIAENESVSYLSRPNTEMVAAEELYLEARIKEHRIYSDETVKNLPDIGRKNVHKAEWRIRKHSASKLFSYLSKNKSHKTILELGCGNGWLSAMLAGLDNSYVVGMDINHMELEQAARVFTDRNNLIFVYGDIFDKVLLELRFDYIILASSVSYFKDVQKLIDNLFLMLNKNGEIHLIDNPSYKSDELAAAKKRSKDYYRGLGVYMMSKNYFHHDLINLVKKYDHRILFNPNRIANKTIKKILSLISPFYWIKITN
jgi:SAM-dependent methyltransferase